MGITVQCLESEDMKRSLGMAPKSTGVYITDRAPLHHAFEVRQEAFSVARCLCFATLPPL
jgi:hypothetical protein